MEILKKIWKLCGEEKGSLQILCVLCTILCLYTVLFMIIPPQLSGMMIILMLMAWIIVWSDDKE